MDTTPYAPIMALASILGPALVLLALHLLTRK